jgi:hypothetical protein
LSSRRRDFRCQCDTKQAGKSFVRRGTPHGPETAEPLVRGSIEKGNGMKRINLTLFLVGSLLAANDASAQCRGGTGQGTTGTTTGTTGAASASGFLGGTGLNTGARLLTGPGSLAYDMMMGQMIAQQMAQQQTMLVMQQQKVREQKLADRRYRAEQTRSQVAESRAKTRAALAAAAGLPARKTPDRALAAYQPSRLSR